jgi:hypothetical protein
MEVDSVAILGRLVTELGWGLNDVRHLTPNQVAAIYRRFKGRPTRKFGSFAEAVAWMRANGRITPE